MTALFKRKKEPLTEKPASTVSVMPTVVLGDPTSRGLDPSMVLLRPHVTEKATDLSQEGVYAFDVNKLASKSEVRFAIEKLYKAKPVKIAIMNRKSKYANNPRNGRLQVKDHGGKKALVYLKKGDKIEFV